MLIFPKSSRVIPKLCHLLATGEIVAVPTETAYGLLADALSNKAVRAVQKIKGREINKPIALVAGSVSQVKKYFFISALEKKLINKFWPGALTLLLKPRIKFPSSIVGHEGLVGVRIPKSVWLRQLCITVDKPLTATSANRSHKPTLFNLRSVIKSLKTKGLVYVVNGGVLKKRLVSTVVMVKQGKIKIIRPGQISEARITKSLRIRV